MPGDLETLMEAMAQFDRRRDELAKTDLGTFQGATNFYSSVRPPKGARVKLSPPTSTVTSLSSNQSE